MSKPCEQKEQEKLDRKTCLYALEEENSNQVKLLRIEDTR